MSDIGGQDRGTGQGSDSLSTGRKGYCHTVRPLCKQKAVWRLEYREEDQDVSLFIIEYCDYCYNHFKEVFPKEGWTRLKND